MDNFLDGFFNWSFVTPSIIFPECKLCIVQANYRYGLITEDLYCSNNIYKPSFFSEMSLVRKCDYLIGRICSKEAIRLLGGNSNSLLLPLLDRTVNWPIEFLGSISHTESVAICCVGNSHNFTNIGIDVEKIMDRRKCEMISNILLSIEEIKVIECININYEKIITLIFSSKETFFKAFYKKVGYIFNFDVLRFLCLNNNKAFFFVESEKIRNIIQKSYIEVYYNFDEKNVYTLIVLA